MIQGVHHISMKCNDPETFQKVIAFYTEILDLKVVRSWEAGVMIDLGNCWLEVFNNGEGSEEVGALRHFALRTDRVDEIVESVREAGYEVFTEPKDILIRSTPEIPARIAFIRGPLHEEIELFDDRSEY